MPVLTTHPDDSPLLRTIHQEINWFMTNSIYDHVGFGGKVIIC